MDLRRVRKWEWFTGAAGLLLLVALFLPWYGIDFVAAGAPSYGSGSANAWSSLAVLDIVLLLAALIAMSLPVVTAMQRTIAVPQALSAFVVWVTLFASIFAIVRLLSPPGAAALGDALGVDVDFLGRSFGGAGASADEVFSTTREIGAWIATIAVLAALVGGWKSMRDKHFPAAMRPNLRIETIPAPSADGESRDAVR
jgi:hypothetical protein